MIGAAILQGSPLLSSVSALYRLHVSMQMSYFGNMINSSSSSHSLRRWIDYCNSRRSRWREIDRKNDGGREWNREGSKEQGGSCGCWRDSNKGSLRWRGHNIKSAHKHTPTYKQTIALCLAVLNRSILISSSPSKPNFSALPWQTETRCVQRSHEDRYHHGDPTESSTAQMWPLSSFRELVALPLSALSGSLSCFLWCQAAASTFI